MEGQLGESVLVSCWLLGGLLGSFGHLIFKSLGVHLVTELGRDDDHAQQVLMAKIRGFLVTRI